MSNTFEQVDSMELAIAGQYTSGNVTFLRLPLISDLNEVNPIAKWTWGEEFQENLLPKAMIVPSLKSKPLTVLIRNDPPFVFLKSYANGSKYAEGYLVDLWKCITERLKLSFVFKYYPTKEQVDFWHFINNGFKVEMERSKADVGLYASADPFDFDSNFTGVHTGVLLRLCLYEKKKRINYYQFIKKKIPYCFKVLLLIGLSFLFLIYIAGNNLLDSTFYFLAILFNQGLGTTLPTTSPVRIAIISFLISVLIFFYTISASMTSISLSDKDIKTTTVEELNDYTQTVRVYWATYTSAYSLMSHSNVFPYFNTSNRVFKGQDPSIRRILSYISQVSGPLAIIDCERVWPLWEEFKCCVSESNLQTMRPSLFLVRRNLPYTQVFRQEFIRFMENGVLAGSLRKWWPIHDASRSEFTSLSFLELVEFFWILAYGVMISWLIFIIERQVRTATH